MTEDQFSVLLVRLEYLAVANDRLIRDRDIALSEVKRLTADLADIQKRASDGEKAYAANAAGAAHSERSALEKVAKLRAEFSELREYASSLRGIANHVTPYMRRKHRLTIPDDPFPNW